MEICLTVDPVHIGRTSGVIWEIEGQCRVEDYRIAVTRVRLPVSAESALGRCPCDGHAGGLCGSIRSALRASMGRRPEGYSRTRDDSSVAGLDP